MNAAGKVQMNWPKVGAIAGLSSLVLATTALLLGQGLPLGLIERSNPEKPNVIAEVLAEVVESPAFTPVPSSTAPAAAIPTVPTITEGVAMAMVNKGSRLGELGRNEDAIAVYDQVIEQFGDNPDPAITQQVARAMANKDTRLGEKADG